MKIDVLCEFAKIYSAFCNETHTLQDVSDIVYLVRMYKHDISDTEKITLLQIPLSVLKKYCEIKSLKDWTSENGSYFAGNMVGGYEPYYSKFLSCDFYLSDIISLLEDIMSDSTKLNNDFYLRNPEVTIRDDVKITNKEAFKACGKIYAKIIEKVI